LRIDSLPAGIGRIPLRFEPQRERPCLAQTADNPSRFTLSRAVPLRSERCPPSVGMGGCFQSESLSAFGRNHWPPVKLEATAPSRQNVIDLMAALKRSLTVV